MKLILSLSLLFYLIQPVPACAAPETTSTNAKLLLLHSFHDGMPWSHQFQAGLQQQLKASPQKTQLFIEYLDNSRVSLQQETIQTYLKNKYKNISFDTVIVDDSPAARFLIDDGGELFSGANVIHVGSVKQDFPPQIFKKLFWLPTVVEYSKNLELIDRIHPGAKRIEFITGASEANRKRIETLRKTFAPYSKRFDIQYFSNFTREELITHVRQLPEDSIIIYGLIFIDREGNKYIPKEVAALIASEAKVPVYSYWQALMGSGITGGYLVSAEKAGAHAAQLALDLHKGLDRGRTFKAAGQSGFYFDWKLLQRWSISEKKLPRGSILINQTTGFWSLYGDKAAAVAVFLLLQTILILLLIRSRSQRGRMTSELASARDDLEQLVVEQTNELFSTRAYFQTLFEQASDGFILMEFQGNDLNVVEANPAACNLRNLSREQLVGSVSSGLWETDLSSRIADLVEPKTPSTANHADAILFCEDRQKIHLEIALRQILSSKNRYILAIERNITDRKQKEELLEKREELLEAEVEARTADLQRAINLMAGREVRMAELKEEIRMLKEKEGSTATTP